MSEQQDVKPTNDQHLLDLLVDGELSDEERRRLLLSLEDQPDGWRRCALVFLESQSWGRNMKAYAAPPLAVVSAAREQRKWSAQVVRGMALAASVLVAFTVGVLVRGNVSADGERGVVETQVVKSGERRAESGEPESKSGGPESTLSPPSTFDSRLTDLDSSSENINLVLGSGRTIEAPLLDADELGGGADMPVATAASWIMRRLEQLGHRVEARRRFAPVTLDDGRQMIVPVDDVRIVPVNRQMY